MTLSSNILLNKIKRRIDTFIFDKILDDEMIENYLK